MVWGDFWRERYVLDSSQKRSSAFYTISQAKILRGPSVNINVWCKSHHMSDTAWAFCIFFVSRDGRRSERNNAEVKAFEAALIPLWWPFDLDFMRFEGKIVVDFHCIDSHFSIRIWFEIKRMMSKQQTNSKQKQVDLMEKEGEFIMTLYANDGGRRKPLWVEFARCWRSLWSCFASGHGPGIAILSSLVGRRSSVMAWSGWEYYFSEWSCQAVTDGWERGFWKWRCGVRYGFSWLVLSFFFISMKKLQTTDCGQEEKESQPRGSSRLVWARVCWLFFCEKSVLIVSLIGLWCEETWPFLSHWDARKARGTHSEERNHEGAWFLYILYFNQGPLLTPFPRKHGQENERLMGGRLSKESRLWRECGFWSRAKLPCKGGPAQKPIQHP